MAAAAGCSRALPGLGGGAQSRAALGGRVPPPSLGRPPPLGPAAAVLRCAPRCDAAGMHEGAGGGRQCLLYDLSDVLTPYEEAWELQKRLVEERTSAAAGEGGRGGVPDALVLVQHPPVYTLGTGSVLEHLKFDIDDPPIPIHRVERGGEVTFHGPGQLVLYPILDLKGNHTPDLHWYMRMLEETVIRALDYGVEIESGRVDGLTGVWTGAGKVAALGVRARRWVSYHGIALNVVVDLEPFSSIVPCGIADKAVASVEGLLGADGPGRLDISGGWREGSGPTGIALTRGAGGAWSPQQAALLQLMRGELLGAFEEVFALELVDPPEGA